MRILLIHNPKAGDRKHSKKQLMLSLRRCGLEAFYQPIQKRGWKQAFKKPVDVVVAAGGDGTVHKTAWQLIGCGIPLAILPLGTANNLARSLGFTAPVEEIIQSLHCGKSRPFDVGVVRRSSRPEYFLEAVGGGLFAHYFSAAEADEKKNASPEEELNAHLSLLRRLSLDYPVRRWQITIDGKDLSDGYILWGAMNIRSAGPALRLAPKAKTDDGLLDFVAVREKERPLFTEYLNARLAGKKTGFPLRVRKFRELQISRRGSTMHFDGEVRPAQGHKPKSQSPIKIMAWPAALVVWRRVLHPA